ncbi:MAG: tetratricopeptide repeat protein [Candidatus Kapabacteria bacterium]|nr:tetratricopeptide repeat protein [Ignavibacteriota bacterium]MCW5884607.1 tetratricopeptide repeat protein [Candidatus Kapabacteria bacterium]
MKLRILILIILSLSFNITISNSQNVNDQRFRLAESFEANGDYESALRIYSELIESEPKSDLYFEGYVRSMKALSKYSELLKKVSERLPGQETIEMIDLYAELNWRTGNTDEANKAWNKVLKQFSKTQKVYMHVSQTHINLRLFEKAIATLLQGRKDFGEPRLFNDPLTKLYIAAGDYKNGTKEIITMLSHDYNLPQAQGRLFALMINEDAKQFIGNELKNISNKEKTNIVYQEVYSWYLRTTGNSMEALELVIRIDEMKNTQGLEIINFATTASRDGDYETALKAYRLIIEKGKKNPYASSALFGFTRALEQRMESDKKNISKSTANEIIDSYKKIISEFPRSGNSADSRIRLAAIYSEILNDNKKAMAELEQLIKEFPTTQYAVSANIQLGMIHIKNDNLKDADEAFNKVKNLHRYATSEQKDFALYHNALITYFNGDIENAVKAFNILAVNSDSDIANDVLRKLFIINSNEQLVAGLELFAKAELREYQSKLDEAVKIFTQVSETASSSMLGETALTKIAEIHFKSSDYKQCLETITKLNIQYPDSKQADKRIMLTADSYYGEGNFGEALKFYTELITKYPESIYLQDARKKIRIIRKDNI